MRLGGALDASWDSLAGISGITGLSSILIDKIHLSSSGNKSSLKIIANFARLLKPKFPEFNMSFEGFSSDNPRPSSIPLRIAWEARQRKISRTIAEAVTAWMAERQDESHAIKVTEAVAGGVKSPRKGALPSTLCAMERRMRDLSFITEFAIVPIQETPMVLEEGAVTGDGMVEDVVTGDGTDEDVVMDE